MSKSAKERVNEYRTRNYVRLNAPEEIQRRANLSKKIRDDLKIKILTHYGKGNCSCAQCGENRAECLSIDHINGKGHQHCLEIKVRGNGFYKWLDQNNLPLGFQTLCMNCNWMKRFKMKEHKKRAFDE